MRRKIILITFLLCYVLQARENIFTELSPVIVTVSVLEVATLDKEFSTYNFFLKDKLELELRKSGVELTNDPEKAKLTVTLDVQISPVKTLKGSILLYSYSVCTKTYAKAKVLENKKNVVAEIWSTRPKIGVTSSQKNMYSNIVDKVGWDCDSFLDRYLRVNEIKMQNKIE
jgi:hypothetical protein